MQNIQQRIMEEVEAEITAKEKELEESDKEIARIWAKLAVEKKVHGMRDLESGLREDFKYGVSALENILMMEEGRNKELEKDLAMLRCRKSAIPKCTEEELQYP